MSDCRRVSLTLLAALFAAQSGVIAMSPVLAQAANDLNVSMAAAGQLRTITGIAPGGTALLLGSVPGRIGLRRQLIGASALLRLGSLASAAAPDYRVSPRVAKKPEPPPTSPRQRRTRINRKRSMPSTLGVDQ